MKSGNKQVKQLYLEDYLKSFHNCLQSLIRLIEKENKFLSHEITLDFEKILEQKEELLKKLQEFDPAPTDLSWKDQKSSGAKLLVDKVSKAYSNLQDVTQANSILLRSNIGASSKILELYKAKQLQHTVEQLGYNKDGEMVALKKLEKVMPSISLNNKI